MRRLLLIYLFLGMLAAGCRLNGPAGESGKAAIVSGRWPEPNILLSIQKLGGGPALDELPVGPVGSFSFETVTTQPLLLLLKGEEVSQPALLLPEGRVEVSPAGNAEGIAFAEADVANQLYQSNTETFLTDLRAHMGRIMRLPPEQVRPLIDSLAALRLQAVDARRRELPAEAERLLRFEVQRRKHAFLFHYARGIRRLPAQHVFFDFIEEIDETDPTGPASNLGIAALKKWDILYRRPRRNPLNTRQFFDYLGEEIPDPSLRTYYQSYYLLQLLQGNELLPEHLEAMDVSDLASMDYHLGKENPYRYLYADLLERYYQMRQGVQAADVTALDTLGRPVRFSDFEGKVIYIDNWASWCGPCMAELPSLHALAEAYRDEPDFVILTMSFDYGFNRWLAALRRQPSFPNVVPLFVEGGIDSDYAQTYLISSIPDYTLLDRNREIVALDAPHPSSPEKLRPLIDGALGR